MPGALQILSAIVVVGSPLVGAVGAVVGTVEDITDRGAFGTEASSAGAWFVLAAVLIAGLAMVLAVLPAGMWLRRIAAAVGALAVLSAIAAVAVTVTGDGCDDFRPASNGWRAALEVEDQPGEVSDAERIAEAIVRCGTLRGKTRDEVRRLLGRPSDTGRTWRWGIGTTNDGIGPGDGQDLIVSFSGDRVVRARLLYP